MKTKRVGRKIEVWLTLEEGEVGNKEMKLVLDKLADALKGQATIHPDDEYAKWFRYES